MDIVDKLLQNGIESFLNNSFYEANMYFSVVLSKDIKNDVARFGVMCIDAIEDGMVEAKEMFNIYIFSSDKQKQYIMEMFESYQSNGAFDETVIDYIQELVNHEGNQQDLYFIEKNLLFRQYEDSDMYGSDFILGKVYEKLGDYDKAIDYIAKAYRTKPFDDNLKKELIQMVRRSNAKR